MFLQATAEAHPASSCPMGTENFSPVVKRPGREVDHSPLPNAEVKNAWRYTTTLQYASMTWYLDKHSDNFTFTLYQLS